MQAKSKEVLAYLKDVFSQYEQHEERLKQANLQLDKKNQQLQANEQRLREANNQMGAINQQLMANESQLKASNLQLDSINQQLLASEQHLKVANQKLLTQTRELLRLAAVVAASNDAIIIRNLEGKITSWNAGATKMYGYTEEEALQMHWLDLVHEDFKFIAAEVLNRLQNNEQVESIETKRVSKDGKTLDVWIVVTKLVDENGDLIGVVSTERDITDRKQMERELMTYHQELERLVEVRSAELREANMQLQAANQQLYASNQQLVASELKLKETLEHLVEKTRHIEKQNEELMLANKKATESDRLKSAFLANMSHEIRTPMNGILGFADLLKTPGLKSENQLQFINIIEKSGERMLNIINEIIDISKIESGVVSVKNTAVDINGLLEECDHFFKPEAQKKNIDLKITGFLPANNAIVYSDRDKLSSVLVNLLKNALKYTEKGSVELGCNLNKPKKELVFFVKDTGIGIPKDRQFAIFERFVQADIEDKMAKQGAGLGLAIARAYVEMMKGEMWLESEEGVGSVFYFKIPYQNVQVSEDAVAETPSVHDKLTKKLKILIADDDEASRMLLSISVEGYSMDVITVKTGKEAIEACRNNTDIDLVLMDIQMPMMNGYEATRKIREFNPGVIIIAQTAFALTGDREKSIAAGCNDYITKPIRSAELKKLIHKYFDQEQAASN